jgi:subtilisin family serine protease
VPKLRRVEAVQEGATVRIKKTIGALVAVVSCLVWGQPAVAAGAAGASQSPAAKPGSTTRAQVWTGAPLSAKDLPPFPQPSSGFKAASVAPTGTACYGDSRSIAPVGGTFDPVSFGAFYDCSQQQWTFEVQTADTWSESSLGDWFIGIDTDGNPNDNCNGYEYAAVVEQSPTTAGQFSAFVEQAFAGLSGCTFGPPPSGTWSYTSNSVSLSFPASGIGSSPSIIWSGLLQDRTEEQANAGGDVVPSTSFVDGPVSGAIADAVPGPEPAGCTSVGPAGAQVVTGVDSHKAAAVLRKAGFADVSDYGEGVVSFTGDASAAARVLAAAALNGRISSAQPFHFAAIANASGFGGTPNDPGFSSQWNLQMVNATGAWSVTTGNHVVVADIDTGVDFTQPDLPSPQLVPGIDESQTPPVRIGYSDGNTDYGQSSSGHGTAVAGVIAAATNNGTELASLGWNTSVMPVKVNLDSSSGDAQIAAGINWAADNTQHPTEPVRIINLSLAGQCPDSAIQAAISNAESKGILVVAAAGNAALPEGLDPGAPADLGYNNPPEYPAVYPGVVAVGAVGRDGYRAAYSDTGDYVSVVAPGGSGDTNMNNDMLLLQPGGSTTSEAGTSFAAPQVSAVSALMLSVNPTLTPGEITQIITGTATDLGPPGRDIEYGYGLLNAGAALAATPPPPPPYEVAFESNTGGLSTVGPAGWTNWGVGVAPGTSPSVARLSNGGYEIAFQASGGALWTVGSAGWTNWGVGMAPRTSPAIAPVGNGGFEVAFQAAGQALWTVGSAGWTNWGVGMAPGTSPAIAPVGNSGFEVAFQAAGQALWSVGSAGWTDWGVDVAPGTSPSISRVGTGGYEVAFQAAGQALWTVGSAGWTDWGVDVAPGTSPSVVQLSNGGYEVAFQAAGGSLWSVGSGGWNNWGVGVAAGTSPSVASLANNGYEIAFQGAAGNLWTVGAAGWTNWPLGMASGTSPAAS